MESWENLIMEARGEQFLKLEIAGHCSSSFFFVFGVRLGRTRRKAKGTRLGTKLKDAHRPGGASIDKSTRISLDRFPGYSPFKKWWLEKEGWGD